jgi:hypothetical protein
VNREDQDIVEAARLASVRRCSNVFEWEKLNAAQALRDRDAFRRGMCWALLFSTIFWAVVALAVAL